MTPEQLAEKLEVSTLELFKRAHAMYGHMWGLQSADMAHRTWKRDGTIPIWLKQYEKHTRM